MEGSSVHGCSPDFDEQSSHKIIFGEKLHISLHGLFRLEVTFQVDVVQRQLLVQRRSVGGKRDPALERTDGLLDTSRLGQSFGQILVSDGSAEAHLDSAREVRDGRSVQLWGTTKHFPAERSLDQRLIRRSFA